MGDNNPLQQKTFKNKSFGTKQNISLQQKTFTSTPIPTRHSSKLQQKNQNVISSVTKKRAKQKPNNRRVLIIDNKVIRIILTIFACSFVAYFDYHILRMLGFDFRSKSDLVYAIIILATSVISAVTWFFSKLEDTEGVIFKYMIAIIFGVIGDLLGFVSSLIFCMIIYAIVAIGKFFWG